MTLINRIKRVVSLDEKVYSEIAEDKGALVQAIIVVLLATVIGEIGDEIGSIISSWGFYYIPILIWALPEWFVWTGITHTTAKLLGGKADFISYLKAIGFAEAPTALGVIPSIGWVIGFVWWLACCIIATNAVHRLSTGKAIIVVVLSFIILTVLIVVR